MQPVDDVISIRSAETPVPARRFSIAFWTALTLLVGLALFLRLQGLAEREPWLDENCTYFLIDRFPQWGAVGEHWRNEVAHLPYVALLKLWSTALGDSMWHLRAWSVLVGTATVLVVAGLGAAVAGRRAAILSALLLALHPLHIHYSREARVYATWMLMIACCMYAQYRAARSNRTAWWMVYAILALLAVLVHYHTLFWLPVTFSAMIIAARPRDFVKAWLLTNLALLPVLLAIVWYLVLPLGGSGPRWWLVSVWENGHPIQVIARSLWAMLPSGAYPDYLGPLTFATQHSTEIIGEIASRLTRWAPCVLALGLVSWQVGTRAVPLTGRNVNKAEWELQPDYGRRAITWLVVLTLGFLMAIWVYSYVVDPAYVVARYDLAVLPAITLAVGIAVIRCLDGDGYHRRCRFAAGFLVTSIFCSCSLAMTYVARRSPVTSDMSRRAYHVAAFVGSNDLVFSLGGFRWFIDYAWNTEGIQAELRSFPPWHDSQLCWDNPDAELRAPERIVAAAKQTVDAMQAALTSDRRVWLLGQPDIDTPRWEVDRRLFEALGAAALQVNPVDEWTGLVEIQRQVRQDSKDTE